MNPSINYGLWLNLMCQCSFINYKIYTSLERDIDNGEAIYMGEQKLYEKSLHLALIFSLNLEPLKEKNKVKNNNHSFAVIHRYIKKELQLEKKISMKYKNFIVYK